MDLHCGCATVIGVVNCPASSERNSEIDQWIEAYGLMYLIQCH